MQFQNPELVVIAIFIAYMALGTLFNHLTACKYLKTVNVSLFVVMAFASFISLPTAIAVVISLFLVVGICTHFGMIIVGEPTKGIAYIRLLATQTFKQAIG